MPSLKSSTCELCQQPFSSFNLPKQRFCSKRCGGLAKRRPVLTRLMERLTNTGDPYECWEWTGSRTPNGYGTLRITGVPRNQRMRLAHRMMWIETFGDIPEGLLVCHHCDNRRCCNPRHFFLGTKADNAQDASEKGRLYVARGEQNVKSKLTEQDVLDIRASTFTHRQIAEQFGVSLALVGFVRQRKVWKHVT